MAGRILNRRDMRADFDAAERRKQEQEEHDELEEEHDADRGEEEGESDEAESEETDAEEEEESPKKRKAAVKTAKPRTRSRAAKLTRLKVVWGVFNNANQRVAVFDYPQRREADEMVAKLRAEKNSTFFVQPVKEPIEEKTHP